VDRIVSGVWDAVASAEAELRDAVALRNWAAMELARGANAPASASASAPAPAPAPQGRRGAAADPSAPIVVDASPAEELAYFGGEVHTRAARALRAHARAVACGRALVDALAAAVAHAAADEEASEDHVACVLSLWRRAVQAWGAHLWRAVTVAAPASAAPRDWVGEGAAAWAVPSATGSDDVSVGGAAPAPAAPAAWTSLVEALHAAAAAAWPLRTWALAARVPDGGDDGDVLVGAPSDGSTDAAVSLVGARVVAALAADLSLGGAQPLRGWRAAQDATAEVQYAQVRDRGVPLRA
jgi:hypothetical protein